MKKVVQISSYVQRLRQINAHLTIFFSYVFFPVSFLLRVLNFRVLTHGSVIGNFCTQIDAYVKEKQLGRIPRYRMIIYPHFSSVFSKRPFRLLSANNYLCHLWKQHFWVVTNPIMGFFLKPILSAPWIQYERPYLSEFPGQSFYAVNYAYYAKNPRFSLESSILKIPQHDREKGWEILQKLGMKKGDWFVCFYAREPGYYNEVDMKNQGVIRNVKVETYKKALLEIVFNGGWCIRMGSSKMEPLPKSLSQLERVIDYPKTDFVSDFMDVFLAATCKFMLTCSSGISMLPGLFGVPIVMTNVIPLHVAKPLYPKDLSILKLYYSKTKNRYLSFSEMLASYIVDQPMSYYYDSLSLTVIDNTEEELFQVTREMLERLANNYKEAVDYQILQKGFEENIPEYLFCKYGMGNIGYQFLKNHQHLLT